MTAEALPMDWELAVEGADDDPDATWVDLLKGKRGRKLPEEATAFLPAALTQCLEGPPPAELACAANRSSPGIDVLPPGPPPSEHTCLGELVPGASAPRVAAAAAPMPPSVDALPDIPTVAEYHEPLIERVAVGVTEPPVRRSHPDLPAVPAGALAPAEGLRAKGEGMVSAASAAPAPLPALAEAAEPSVAASPWSRGESGPLAGTPALASRPRRAPSRGPAAPRCAAPQPEPPRRRRPTTRAGRADTAPSGPVIRGVPAEDLQAALRSPAAASIPAVPTWAAQATQMEGPGVWIETEAEVPARARTVVPAQRHVPTTVGPMPSHVSVVAARPRKRSLMNEVVPFALVLIAISLATAALVGAYL